MHVGDEHVEQTVAVPIEDLHAHRAPGRRGEHHAFGVLEATAAKRCQLAVLVPPARMQHVEQIAGNLEKMPPKSTYFYPKLLSGLVFNPLKGS